MEDIIIAVESCEWNAYLISESPEGFQKEMPTIVSVWI
jgi:hypothetical protein